MNSNKFNDWIYCYYKDEYGEQKFHPILAPDQYPGCRKLGLHKGKYKALVQTGNVKVYRGGVPVV